MAKVNSKITTNKQRSKSDSDVERRLTITKGRNQLRKVPENLAMSQQRSDFRHFNREVQFLYYLILFSVLLIFLIENFYLF